LSWTEIESESADKTWTFAVSASKTLGLL